MLGENDGDRAIWAVHPDKPVLVRDSSRDIGSVWAWRFEQPCDEHCLHPSHRAKRSVRGIVHFELFMPGTMGLIPVGEAIADGQDAA